MDPENNKDQTTGESNTEERAENKAPEALTRKKFFSILGQWSKAVVGGILIAKAGGLVSPEVEPKRSHQSGDNRGWNQWWNNTGWNQWWNNR